MYIQFNGSVDPNARGRLTKLYKWKKVFDIANSQIWRSYISCHKIRLFSIKAELGSISLRCIYFLKISI